MKVTLKDAAKPAAAAAVEIAKDVLTLSTGRTIKLATPPILAQYDLVAALGDLAENSTYLRMVTPLLHVAEIDGETVDAPSKLSQVRALIQRLGEEGISAIVGELNRRTETALAEIERSEESRKATVKN